MEFVSYPEDPTAASFAGASSSPAEEAFRVPVSIGCLGELHRRHLQHSLFSTLEPDMPRECSRRAQNHGGQDLKGS